MTLSINTKDRSHIEVKLIKAGKIVRQLSKHNDFGSQVLLSLIIELLNWHSLKFSDVHSIEVETGPGSYTGLKVGVAIANALAFSLAVPVNGKAQELDLIYT